MAMALNVDGVGEHAADAGMLPAVSPYDIPVTGLDHFRDLLGRWVEFDRLEADDLAAHPLLLIGAVDVLSGRFRAFHSHHERITADMVLASAAIPTVFPAIHTDGGVYWDGLFSQNPPVRELLEAQPDELWVIQINPTATDREPRSVLDITDRRNELSGNLSLYQELHVIEKIDQLLADGLLIGDRYKQVTVRVIEMSRPASSRLLGPASKLNRDRGFPARADRTGRTPGRGVPDGHGVRAGVAAPGRGRARRPAPRRCRPRVGGPFPRARDRPGPAGQRGGTRAVRQRPDGPDPQAGRPGSRGLDGRRRRRGNPTARADRSGRPGRTGRPDRLGAPEPSG